jgi:mannose-6-phosphate isomerase
MPDLTTPLRFESFLRPMVWGGRLLEHLGKQLPTGENYGESWEVSDHPLAPSVVAEGPWQGATLRSLIADHAAALLGKWARANSVFPWLIKFLDAHDWLSVQVHPDGEAVRKLGPGEGPKNEAWFVLEAQPGSLIYAGLLPGVGPAELRAALAQGTVADCLHRFSPRRGDFLYLPAGTVHAVGGGVLLAEVQQTSDATFRLFDWNRRDSRGNVRKLHIEEALACVDWARGPVKPLHVAEVANSKAALVPLAQTPYFDLRFIRNTEGFVWEGAGRFQAFCVLQGGARFETGARLLPGQVWLFPAMLEPILCEPEPALAGILCAP